MTTVEESRPLLRAEEAFVAQLALRPQGEPGFRAAQRAAGAEAFQRLRLPTVRQEDWRYTNVGALGQLPFVPAPPATADLARVPQGPATLGLAAGAPLDLPPAPRLVFVNGRFDFGLSDLSELPAGAFAGSLADALGRTPELVEPWLGRRVRAGEHAFAALNAALAQDGAVVLVPEGLQVPATIHVVHLTLSEGEAAAVHPRNILVVAPGARVSVAELYAGGDGPYLVNALTEVYAGDGAAVEHVRLQRDGARAFHVGLVEVEQGQGSAYHGQSIALGGQLARVETRALLAGPKADCTLDGLYVAGGRQLVDHLVLVDHAAPECTSHQHYKGILDEHARGVFAGRILVRQDAQKTDAAQTNSNLLLSDDAEIDTKPQLEILADDVKCSHGGTVGQLDESALFYLRSRGIDAGAARAMLTYAFASEVVDRVRRPELRSRVRRLVAGRLPDGERLLEASA